MYIIYLCFCLIVLCYYCSINIIDIRNDIFFNTKENELKILLFFYNGNNVTKFLDKNNNISKLNLNKNNNNYVLFLNENSNYYCDLKNLYNNILYIHNNKILVYEYKLYDNFVNKEIKYKYYTKEIINENYIIYYDYKIAIINNLVNDNLSNELISFLDKNKEIHHKERFKRGSNVLCDYININNFKLKLLKNKDQNKDILNYVLKLDKNICDIFSKGINIYKEIFKMDNNNFKDCGYTLRKHIGETRLHSDGPEISIEEHTYRILTGIIILNSDYDGAIFEFPDFNLKFKLKKGSLLLFPPYWTHPHCVSNLKNDTFRYSINTWFLNNF